MEKQSLYKLIKPIIIIIYIILGCLAFKFMMEYVLKWIFPFIIGFLLSRMALPLGRQFEKKLKLHRKISSIAASVIVIILCLLAVGLTVFFIYTRLVPFLAGLSETYQNAAAKITATWDRILTFIDRLPSSVADSLKNAINAMPEKIDFIKLLIVPLLNAAGSLPMLILSIIATIVSTFLFVLDNENIGEFIKKLVKPSLYEKIDRTYRHLFGTLFKWLKAQLILCSVCFTELLIGFLILRLRYAFLIALLICLIDFLPVLGAGTVLIPWALVSLALGDFSLAIGLAVIYIVILAVRNMLEPNVVGIQIGMHPLVTLFSLYVGFRMYGFLGMFFLPLVLLTLIQLNKWKYIRLWETDDLPDLNSNRIQ